MGEFYLISIYKTQGINRMGLLVASKLILKSNNGALLQSRKGAISFAAILPTHGRLYKTLSALILFPASRNDSTRDSVMAWAGKID